MAAPDGGERDSVFFEAEFPTRAYTLSHDGKWLAYVSNRFGHHAVYVRPFPAGDEVPVSSPGGKEPRWGPWDSELFHITGNELVSARIDVTDGVFRVESREVLFDVTEYPSSRPLIPAR